MFLVANKILSHILADRYFICDSLMTNLIWKSLIKSLGMNVHKTKYCYVLLYVYNYCTYFLVVKENSPLEKKDTSPLLKTHTHTYLMSIIWMV